MNWNQLAPSAQKEGRTLLESTGKITLGLQFASCPLFKSLRMIHTLIQNIALKRHPFQIFYLLSKPLTWSVVGRGGGGPTPLVNQHCW